MSTPKEASQPVAYMYSHNESCRTTFRNPDERKRPEAAGEYLSTEEIAALLKCTRKNVTQRVVTAPDFPRPKVNRSQKMRLWDAAEVRAWAECPTARQSQPA